MFWLFAFFKKKFEKHVKHCAGMPGIWCKFKNQNFITLDKNCKFRVDFHFAAYFDFETTNRSILSLFSCKVLIKPNPENFSMIHADRSLFTWFFWDRYELDA